MVKKTTKKQTSKTANITIFEPMKVGLLVSTIAAVTLVLFAIIALSNSQL